MSSSITHYAQIVWFKAWAELRTEAAKTYIGILWWIFDPVLYMFVFYVVFSQWRDVATPDFVQFLLVGLVFFRWFTNTVMNASGSIQQNRGLIQQVYLPKILFPLVTFYKDTFKFLITLVLLVAYLWISGFPPAASYIYLPLLLMIQLVLTLGCVFLVAATVPVLPDLRFLVTHGMTVLLFMSGTFYSGEQLPPDKQKIFYMNPLAVLLESYRDVLMYGEEPRWDRLVVGTLTGLGFLVIGVWILVALDRRYPRIVKVR